MQAQTWSMLAMILSSGGVPLDSAFEFTEPVLGSLLPGASVLTAGCASTVTSTLVLESAGMMLYVLCADNLPPSELLGGGRPLGLLRGFNLPKHRLHQWSTLPLSGWKATPPEISPRKVQLVH